MRPPISGNRIVYLFAVLFLWTLTACAPVGAGDSSEALSDILRSYPELKGHPVELATVGRVIDGDTFVTSEDNIIRLIGVDTPEVHGQEEAFGKEASNYSKRMLTGQKVYLIRDISETDRYGRLLRYVFIIGDSTMFNERLIADGFANRLTYPPDVLMAELFRDAERKARKEKLGLWAAEAEEHPKTAQPEATCKNPLIKGNINSRGDKIYHRPGDSHYEQTKPESWFCTEEEAVDAGFRAPK